MPLSVIGMGLSYEDLTENHLSLIREAEVLAGGKRHLNQIPSFSGEKIEIRKNLKELVQKLAQLLLENRKIVVLASGDPMFYGIGTYLVEKLGTEKINVYPNVSSVAAAFSKIKVSWHNAKVLSLHGHSLETHHIEAFREHDKLAILTGGENTPARVCDRLSKNGISDFDICVFEKLGSESESIQWFEPDQLLMKTFSEPNLMVFIRRQQKEKNSCPEIYPGMPGHLFKHQRGLITKSEIRAVTLSKLRLEPKSVLWDLGAGSGSVAIEASLFIRKGRIYAVEKNESRIVDIEENRKRFQVSNLEIHHGILPGAINTLPDPDRIFIGGGGHDLVTIIERAAKRLLPGGMMVVNTVLLKNVASTLDTLENLEFKTEIIQMQVNIGHEMPWNQMLKSQNPIWIIQGQKTIYK